MIRVIVKEDYIICDTGGLNGKTLLSGNPSDILELFQKMQEEGYKIQDDRVC